MGEIALRVICFDATEREVKNMNRLSNFLDGKKTNIVAAAAAVVFFAGMMGWISNEEMAAVLGFLGISGVITFRDAIRKI